MGGLAALAFVEGDSLLKLCHPSPRGGAMARRHLWWHALSAQPPPAKSAGIGSACVRRRRLSFLTLPTIAPRGCDGKAAIVVACAQCAAPTCQIRRDWQRLRLQKK